MSVKYSWSRQNGAAVPPVRFMSIEPAEDYYKGMPLKLKEKGIVEPTDGDPEYICMAQYDPDTEIQPLEIPVQEVFPDVVYDRMNEDGTTEEVRFGSKGGGGDLLETVTMEVPLEITWDGNIEGKEMMDTGNGNETFFVKISDMILTKEQVLNAVAVSSHGEEIILTEDEILDLSSQGIPAILCGSFILAANSDFDVGDGIVHPSGLYFYYVDSDSYVTHLTCPNATTTTTKQQIKTELLPDGYPYITTEEKSVECPSMEDNGGQPFILEGFPAFAVGDTVKVKVDGVEYSLVANEIYNAPVIGDHPEQIEQGDGEYGWTIACVTYTGVIFQASEPHTVSWELSVAVPINHKLLPEGYPYSIPDGIVRMICKYASDPTEGVVDLIRLLNPSHNETGTIVVLCDGVKYVCELRSGGYTNYIGNNSLVTTRPEGGLGEIVDTGEPFFIGFHDYNTSYAIFEQEGTHLYTAYVPGEEIHTIDPKYMAKDVLYAYGIDVSNGVATISSFHYTDGTKVTYANSEGIDENFRKNRTPFVICNYGGEYPIGIVTLIYRGDASLNICGIVSRNILEPPAPFHENLT